MPQTAKVHLILRGYALCDFQARDGGRCATTSVRVFKSCGDEACKECARKLAKLEGATKKRAAVSDPARTPEAASPAALIDDLVIALRTLLDHIILADAPDDDPAIAAARAALAKAGRLT